MAPLPAAAAEGAYCGLGLGAKDLGRECGQISRNNPQITQVEVGCAFSAGSAARIFNFDGSVSGRYMRGAAVSV